MTSKGRQDRACFYMENGTKDILHPSIHFSDPCNLQPWVTGASWSLSQLSMGEGTNHCTTVSPLTNMSINKIKGFLESFCLRLLCLFRQLRFLLSLWKQQQFLKLMKMIPLVYYCYVKWQHDILDMESEIDHVPPSESGCHCPHITQEQ